MFREQERILPAQAYIRSEIKIADSIYELLSEINIVNTGVN